MKINANITPWLEIGANANFQDRSDGDIQVSIGDNYWDANMLRNSPFASYRKEDGSLEQYPFNGSPTNGGYNYDFDRQYLDLEKGYTTLNTIFNAQVKLPSTSFTASTSLPASSGSTTATSCRPNCLTPTP